MECMENGNKNRIARTSQELETVQGRLTMKKNKRVQLTKEQLLEQWKAREQKPDKATKVDKSLQNTK